MLTKRIRYDLHLNATEKYAAAIAAHQGYPVAKMLVYYLQCNAEELMNGLTETQSADLRELAYDCRAVGDDLFPPEAPNGLTWKFEDMIKEF